MLKPWVGLTCRGGGGRFGRGNVNDFVVLINEKERGEGTKE